MNATIDPDPEMAPLVNEAVPPHRSILETILGEVQIPLPAFEISKPTHGLLRRGPEHPRDGVHDLVPTAAFTSEMFSPGGRNAIILGFAIVLGDSPLGRDHAAVFEPLQREIKRSMIDEEDFLRLPLDASGNSLSMTSAKQHRLQNEQVQRTLQQRDTFALFLTGRHTTRSVLPLGSDVNRSDGRRQKSGAARLENGLER